jgi:DNA-binding winged helix-turn-helix (wHTH) protein
MFEFGQFVLDEPGRVLRLSQREIPLQPRVFDLLVYLVRNQARVVSKEELLDILWPGVTVTENSLQRAVSALRKALREGGMEDVLRSFPRNGYRFCIEPSSGEGAIEPFPSAALSAARSAVAEQRWDDASKSYQQADNAGSDELTAQDLERWALALQCLGRPSDAVPVLIRANAAFANAGNTDAATRSAIALSTIHFERGEPAVAKGWIARAEDLIATESSSTVGGRVLWMKARIAAFENDPESALKLAEAAYEHGRAQRDVITEALGLMYRGFYRLSLGDTRGGLSDQDHAATLAFSNRIDPITGGVLYCNILWACRTFADWARASQWTLGYQQFCSDHRMDFSGSCRLHRAEYLGVRGSLNEALAHVNDAISGLPHDAPWALGDAYRVLGDINSDIGNTDAAMAAYEKCYALGWSPEPGYAMLLLEGGEAEAAFSSLERSLMGQSWWTLQRQGMLLAHLALIAACSGRTERAQSLIADLSEQEGRWPMPAIRALTNEAAGMLLLKQSEPHESLRYFHLARQLWSSIDSRLNAARLRLRLADVLLETGDLRGALAELRAASSTGAELGSDKIMKQCGALQLSLEEAERLSHARHSPAQS